MDGGKMVPCPVCLKGKYKESALIQHLIDKHPDYPASQKLRNEFQFPTICPICSQKISTGVALMSHYSISHPSDYAQFKSHLGFDFCKSDSCSSFPSSTSFQILPGFDPVPVYFISTTQNMYKTINSHVEKSPILFASLENAQYLVIGSKKAIIVVESSAPRLGEYIDSCINNRVPIISLNSPPEIEALGRRNINISTNIKSNPFACQEYIQFIREYGSRPSKLSYKIDINNPPSNEMVKWLLSNIALAYIYLQQIGFFPHEKTEKQETQSAQLFQCPCCQVNLQDSISLYRHLYRMHPIISTVLNQYKLPDQPKGVFICEKCHEQNIENYDSLIIHVFNEHREELLIKTRQQLLIKPDEAQINPQLFRFIENELSLIQSKKSTE